MSTNYTRWYRVGKVNVTNGSTAVVGTDTYWASAGLHPGDIFRIDDTKTFEIDTITDNTHITLKTAYTGSTASGTAYSIIRNFTSTSQAENAAQVTDLVSDMRRYIDTDMQSIHGKSAYEVAVSNGYVGTEQQWLNYLIGAGKWVELDAATKASLSAQDTKIAGAISTANAAQNKSNALDTRTSFINDIYSRNWNSIMFAANAFQNSIYRGKALGSTFTDDHAASISHVAKSDLFVGDYWDVKDLAYTYKDADGVTQSATFSDQVLIAGFNLLMGQGGYNAMGEGGNNSPHIIVLPRFCWFTANMNDTDTTEGGYLASKMHTVHMNRVAAILKAFFGESHVKTFKEVLSTSPTSGAVATMQAMLMTKRMVLGTPDSQNGLGLPFYRFMNNQLPLFHLSPHWIGNGNGYFLQDVIDEQNFAGFYSNAQLTVHKASVSHCVRAIGVIG